MPGCSSVANPDHFSTRQDDAFDVKRLNSQLPHSWTDATAQQLPGAAAPQPDQRSRPTVGPAQIVSISARPKLSSNCLNQRLSQIEPRTLCTIGGGSN